MFSGASGGSYDGSTKTLSRFALPCRCSTVKQLVFALALTVVEVGVVSCGPINVRS